MQTNLSWLSRRRSAILLTGVLAGIGSGVVFALWGVIVAVVLTPLFHVHETPILLQIAAIVHSSSSMVGLIVHLVISAIVGTIFAFGVLLYRGIQRHVITWAALYGIAWWGLGTLTLLPLLDDLAPRWDQALQLSNLFALIGHAIFGVMLGIGLRLGISRSQ
jgi:uncharacterized membrane protein YagU involved in acid resistance